MRTLLSLVIVLTGFALTSAPVSLAQTAEQTFYVKDTGHTIGGDFLEFWQANEGKDWLGLPVTEPLEDGDSTIQYYEYGVLVSDPDNADSDVPVEFVPVGLHLLQEKITTATTPSDYRLSNRLAPMTAATDTADGTMVPTTMLAWPQPPAERVDLIAQAYEEKGGADRFGAPITDPMVTNGEVVQWFERGRLSVFTRGNQEVRVGALGWELALLRNVPMEPVDAGDLPLFDGEGDITTPVFAGDGYIPEASGPFTPVRLVVPSLGIDAPIEWTGIVGGVMQTPSDPMAVGWYGDISMPGTGQTVVMAGHVDYYTIGPAVFYSLSSAGPGTMFYLVGPDGSGATYVFSYSYTLGAWEPADPILAGTGVDSLTLITCTGGFDGAEYDSRLVVYAERI